MTSGFHLTRHHLIYLAVVAGLAGAALWLLSPNPEPPTETAAFPAATQPAPSPQVIEPLPATAEPLPDAATVHTGVGRPKAETYTVKPGDTVESIAQRFGLKTASVLWSNGIRDEDLLQVGETLKIPAADGILHQTVEGDTIWEIAESHGVHPDEVIKANPDVSPDMLRPDQTLLVPGGLPAQRIQVASRSGVSRPGQEGHTASRVGTSGLLWPVLGEITDQFGWRIHPVYSTKNFHEGIDIAVPTGTPVKAALAGKVLLAEWYGGYGLTVKIDHGNGLVSRYSHNEALLVKIGENVTAGQVVASSGNTGVSTGPHLDFGLYRNGVPVDPLDMLPRQ